MVSYLLPLNRRVLLWLFYWVIAPAVFATTSDLIPKSFVGSFLKDYSEEERDLVEEDLSNIIKLCFRHKSPATGQPIYVATAGGPGAGKSTILETWLQCHPDFVYADPDPRALKFMIETYLQSLTYYKISKTSSYEDLLQTAYHKWRAASNYIACTILNMAFQKGFNITHGTTSTAKEVAELYKRLKEKNYKIILLLCGSSDQNRINAIRHRAKTQGFIQNSEQDAIQKGKLFPERFPIYFQNADEIHFYWTEDFSKGNIKAGTFSKKEGLTIENQQAYNSFVKNYEDARQENKELVPFESFIS